jgi:hypothetical protein
MIKTILASLVFAGFSMTAQANIRSGTLINLKVKDASQVLELHYPGPISGICGLKLVTS